MIVKECINCGKSFNVHKCRENKASYCSTDCKYEHKRNIGRSLKDCKCEFCGKEFKVERRHLGKFCSEECFHTSRRRRIIKQCLNCGIEFEIKRTTTMNCCSMKCRFEYQNKNRVDRNYYRTYDWRKTRIETLERDEYKCCICGNGNIELNVHHKIPVSKGGHDTLDNLETLCIECHREVHGYKILRKGKLNE